MLVEKYPEPVSSMKREITIALTGTYTVDESMLTIATRSISGCHHTPLEEKQTGPPLSSVFCHRQYLDRTAEPLYLYL